MICTFGEKYLFLYHLIDYYILSIHHHEKISYIIIADVSVGKCLFTGENQGCQNQS